MYLLLISPNTFRNELRVAVLHGRFCVDVGLYLDAVSRAACVSKRWPRFHGTPAESYVAAALGDMLLYFGVHVLSNVTESAQCLQLDPEIENWDFPKMAATNHFCSDHSQTL